MNARQWVVWCALALLSTGCASLTPLPGRGTHLRYSPHGVAVTVASPGSVGGAKGSVPAGDAARRWAMGLR
ncbi:MAG TPA: hypothetical protein VEU33_34335 [Archangium sp.]|nr:hypothetical protein [Archangium sp.]